MSKARVLLAVCALVLLVSAFARADNIIYDNGGPNQQDGNEMTEWVQTEDFVLKSDQTLTDLHFWDIEASPGYFGSITWWVVGDDGNGNPNFNNILGTENTTNNMRVQLQCGIFGIYCEYSNWIDLTTPIALKGGVTYHLALHNGPVTNDAREEFYWETTNPNGTQTGLECDLTTGACYSQWFNNGNEHAFYLTGGQTNVPEPGTLALMGTGILGALAGLRRRF